MPYISGPTIWSDSFSNGVPLTARRARVFFSTRRYTPDFRAFGAQLRHARDVQAAVLRDDDRLGARQLGRDFRDHRLLLLQIKTQGLPPACCDSNGRLSGHANHGVPGIGNAVCAGRNID